MATAGSGMQPAVMLFNQHGRDQFRSARGLRSAAISLFVLAVLLRTLDLPSFVIVVVPSFMLRPAPLFMVALPEVFALPDESVGMLPGASPCR